MRDNLTEIVAILDRSGSMRSLQEDTIGGFNSFIEKQKAEDGEANLTTVLFDDKYEVLYEAADLKEVKPITNNEYYARGMTALLDAVGKTIASIGGRLASMNEEDRPGKVIFLITTDGAENSSQEYTTDKIKEMVSLHERIYSWEFVFVGANIDSFGEGGKMGYSGHNTANYEANSRGINTTYSALSMKTASFRKTGKSAVADSMDDLMKKAEAEVDSN